ncbi:hypothetical protein NKH18_40810 [Streptomyces sp. M10(2022)]
MGRRIEPQAAWGDLVLAERQLRVLREITAHVRQRPTVYQEWGFAETLRRGWASPRSSRAAPAPARRLPPR